MQEAHKLVVETTLLVLTAIACIQLVKAKLKL